MRINGSQDNILRLLVEKKHNLLHDLEIARAAVPVSKREVWIHQAAVLYVLAARCNRSGANILEIGTAWGYSAAVMALAAPKAKITTLNPRQDEYSCAAENLAGFHNVVPLQIQSEDFLSDYEGPELDMIFIDGDHSRDAVLKDMEWWRHLKSRRLMLFHDYSPEGSKRATPKVFDAVNELWVRLGRGFDVLVVDDDSVGMAGFYKREGEVL